jgi:hypothetical protein
MADKRLTLRQAAAALGTSEAAIRKRVELGTLRSDKGPDGKRYVYVDTGAGTMSHEGTDTSAAGERDVLVSEMVDELRDEIHYLRGQLHQELERRSAEAARYQQTLADLTKANNSLTERLRALEAPREAHSEPVAVPEPSVDAEPARTTHPAATYGFFAPVNELPWWHYVVGLILVFLTGLFVWPAAIKPFMATAPTFLLYVIIFAILWLPPSVFGFWVGLKVRNPSLRRRIIPFGVLVGALTVVGVVLYVIWVEHLSVGSLKNILILAGGVFIPPWLLYVSGVLIGNAWQRRRTGRISGSTPTSPIARTTSTSLRRREDWTPRKQAILGWSGTIIAAILSLLGTIITALSQ